LKEGWLTLEDLEGLSADKIAQITKLTEFVRPEHTAE